MLTKAQKRALEIAKNSVRGRVSSNPEVRSSTVEALQKRGLVRAHWPIGLEAMVTGRGYHWYQITTEGRKALGEAQ